MHENWVNTRRNTRTCFQCGKSGHFIADCLEKVENRDNYKQKSKTDGRYRSRRNHKSKHKGKRKTSNDRGRRRDEARLEQ
jgi:hypothetical protein